MHGFQNALAAVGILLVVTFVMTPGAAAREVVAVVVASSFSSVNLARRA